MFIYKIYGIIEGYLLMNIANKTQVKFKDTVYLIISFLVDISF